MAEAKGVKSGNGSGAAARGSGDGAPAGGAGVKFKNIWPIPALALGAVLLIGGIVQWIMIQPKPPADIPLEQAKALVKDKRFQEAIDKLNSKEVRNYIDYGSPDDEHMRAFHLARARAFAGAQATLGLSRPENHKSIVEDYEKAEKEGKAAELDVGDVSQLIESLIALDEVDSALKRINGLPEGEAARKTRLTRAVVEHNLAVIAKHPEQKRSDQTLELLARLASDPGLSSADKAWVLARQGEMLLSAGQPEEAINKLIRRVGLLKDVPPELQGELYVLLGKAYFQADQPSSAMRQLEAADGLLSRSSPLRADLGVMQGRLAQSGVAVEGGPGNTDNDPTRLLEFAREKFEGVILEFGGGKAYARAVLGVAEVEAALRHDDKSLEKYAELVEMVNEAGSPSTAMHGEEKKSEGAAKSEGAGHATKTEEKLEGKPEAKPEAKAEGKEGGHGAAGGSSLSHKAKPRDLGEVTRERVTTSLTQRFHERFDSGQRESALRYATMAESLYPDADVPAEVLLAIGTTRRAMGDQLMAAAKEAHAADATKSGAEFSVEDLDPTTRAEVRRNYVIAGDYLRRHAKAVAATDLGAAAASLWTAADSYDRAGDIDEAKKAFADYADTASDTDPNRPAAKFRLAQVFQAKKEYGAAEALYRALKDSRDPRDPSRSAGDWSDKSIVPLAQCLLSDADPANDEEAERLLIGVVDGTANMLPNATAFREALIELGSSCYRRERFADAIGWLEQAVKRYKDDKRIESVRYLLADSHRREGVKIGKTLSMQKLPQAQTDELEAKRVEHLRSARAMYDMVRAALEAKDARTLTGLEKIQMRNAYFYAGDCAMELKDYDGAIGAYDAARLKYSDNPASLMAMAQIVTAYALQEKWVEARTANERARQQLAKFPESVWQDPDLPMEKRHWERWLDARTIIGQQQAAPEKE